MNKRVCVITGGGSGMCLCMRFDNIPAGIVVGMVGILLLLLLIPLVKSED